jgi:tryptophan synthase alpha chain
MGVTGQGKLALDSVDSIVARVKSAMPSTSKPFVVGFGVTSSDICARIGRVADGVVIGSHLLRLLTATDGTLQIDHSVTMQTRKRMKLLCLLLLRNVPRN